MVIGNIWAVLHDEAVYPEPESFIPERFLEEGVPDSLHIAFGFGRRCVEFLPLFLSCDRDEGISWLTGT